ncbi:O-methyltransferase [Aspergillus ibericus CBS 121593]|uniref:O-methyltransferase n=1 Tax=Aspergillus ibericus CBS 121593 TaxID=1448316 RepID=A0A395H0U0_9EURO|nr:O-methyltransferase [Aspergillus ibericus CBS 121593]RAL01220.1 O-methyltransferase [Aspergillus ibericus CBS 121593]
MATFQPSLDHIQQSLAEVTAAVDQYRAQVSSHTSQDARYQLMVQATRLVHAIRGPADLVFANFENMVGMGAIRTLLEAGVFDAIPTGGQSISAAEITAKTGVDKEIIVRLMRALTPVGPFRETGEEQYAHTPESEILLAPQMRAVFGLMIDEYSPAMLRTHEFLRQQNWQHRIGLRSNPYTLVHGCEGQTMFEHISQDPVRVSRLNDAMVAEDTLLAEIGLYPFVETLGPLAQPDRATVVDVGGGRGHILRQLKQNLAGLPGRYILQDREMVIADNGSEMETDGIEPMAHDFFEAQPVKGALVYFVRRVLHDWPDEEVRQILEHLAGAMDRDKSRILITETIIPEVGATTTNAYMDLTMMTFGGRERTVKDFAHLFDLVGLKLANVYQAPGVPMVVVEARLK